MVQMLAVYLDFNLEITSENDLWGAQDAFKASQDRSQTLSKTLFRRLRESLGALLGGLGHLGGPRDAPDTVLGPLGTHFLAILDPSEPHVGVILHQS